MRVTDCQRDCKGHKRYVGGIMDGAVSHLVHAAPSDFPRSIGTLLRQGQRSWYLRDDEASDGTEVVYRLVGVAREMPEACR